MNTIQHVLLARALIDACGGVDACCKPATRVERSALYAYRSFEKPTFMPADVIEALESLCENPVYSAFLFNARASASAAERLDALAFVIGEGGMEIQRAIRLATADDELSPQERREIEQLLLGQEERLRAVRTAMAGDGA